MKILDFGKFQTAHVGFQKTLGHIAAISKSYNSFVIIGETGSGRRQLAQMIHENSVLAGQSIRLYSKESIAGLRQSVILVHEIQFLDFRDQEILTEQILASDSSNIWIATAQSDFRDLVKRGLVRKDLAAQFQKEIQIPSLTERACDQEFLMDHILMTLSWVTGKVFRLTPQAQDLLCRTRLAGNIAELEEILEASVLATTGSLIDVEHLKSLQETSNSQQKVTTLAEMERKLILQTLEITQNNKSQAARLLGISIRTLRNKLTQYREDFAGGLI